MANSPLKKPALTPGTASASVERAFPPWLRKTWPAAGAAPVVAALSSAGVDTVCRGARCPNRAECHSLGRAAFLLLGPSCTRRCAFCAIDRKPPAPPDPAEPARVVEAARQMGLNHVVVTSVTRDDLADGGASHFAATVAALKAALPQTTVEILVPDFYGDPGAWETAVGCGADVFNHNIETAPSLYPEVRPGADYDRSLALLDRAVEAQPARLVKSGLMVGLGETFDEALDVAEDLRGVGVSMITVGQYLCPVAGRNRPVDRFVPPDEFDEMRGLLEAMGFRSVVCHPFARSSYHAEEALATRF